MIVVPFKREHLTQIKLQPWQEDQLKFVTAEILDVIEKCDSYTILDGDEVLVCAGVFLIGFDRHGIWSYVS